MELRTYTSLWNVEKKLYSLGDFKLPIPVGVKQLGAAFGAGIPWMFFLNTVGFPFKSPYHVVWFAVPVGLAYFAGKPVKEGKRLFDLLGAQFRYIRQNREYARLAPAKGPQMTLASARVWVPKKTLAPDDQPSVPAPPDLPRPQAAPAHIRRAA